MDITIEQNAISLGAQYEITTPGCIYSARRRFLAWPSEIRLTGPRERLVATISRRSFFGFRYEFELAEGPIYGFRREKLWKGVFVCEGTGGVYQLYKHKGLNYSIFQGETQIAAMSKNQVAIGNGNVYEIRANDDADVIVVVCMVLAIAGAENLNSNAGVTFDFGNIGPEARPFDRSWEPS